MIENEKKDQENYEEHTLMWWQHKNIIDKLQELLYKVNNTPVI